MSHRFTRSQAGRCIWQRRSASTSSRRAARPTRSCTTPLKGLFARAKGGFYHDGRFEDYNAVVAHYNRVHELSLSTQETADLVEFLKSF
jgi:hypothetical protein